jgi:hypothetical protein
MLSDVGLSNFKRLVMFCTEKEQDDRALRRKMFIETRKRFLEAHKNHQDELLPVRYTINDCLEGCS